MKWQVIDTGPGTAAENMELDRTLLRKLKASDGPILHLYGWRGDCATYGYFVQPGQFLNLDAVKQMPLDLARRPTGGGIVFHKADLAFSVLIPTDHPFHTENTLQNYAFINGCVAEALSTLLNREVQPELLPENTGEKDCINGRFCMARPTIYDVIIEGKKAGGAAQRRTKCGYLHQGTISLGQPPKPFLERLLLPDTGVLEAIQAHTFSLLPKNWSSSQLDELRAATRQALISVFRGKDAL